jgi:hypothetical protein
VATVDLAYYSKPVSIRRLASSEVAPAFLWKFNIYTEKRGVSNSKNPPFLAVVDKKRKEGYGFVFGFHKRTRKVPVSICCSFVKRNSVCCRVNPSQSRLDVSFG